MARPVQTLLSLPPSIDADNAQGVCCLLEDVYKTLTESADEDRTRSCRKLLEDGGVPILVEFLSSFQVSASSLHPRENDCHRVFLKIMLLLTASSEELCVQMIERQLPDVLLDQLCLLFDKVTHDQPTYDHLMLLNLEVLSLCCDHEECTHWLQNKAVPKFITLPGDDYRVSDDVLTSMLLIIVKAATEDRHLDSFGMIPHVFYQSLMREYSENSLAQNLPADDHMVAIVQALTDLSRSADFGRWMLVNDCPGLLLNESPPKHMEQSVQVVVNIIQSVAIDGVLEVDTCDKESTTLLDRLYVAHRDNPCLQEPIAELLTNIQTITVTSWRKQASETQPFGYKHELLKCCKTDNVDKARFLLLEVNKSDFLSFAEETISTYFGDVSNAMMSFLVEECGVSPTVFMSAAGEKEIVREGSLEAVKYLTDHGAYKKDEPLEMRVFEGRYNLLSFACFDDAIGSISLRLEILRLLVKNGADVNERNLDGSLPLLCALDPDLCADHITERVTCLIELGAEVNNVNNDWGIAETALHQAMYNPLPEIVSLLLDRGAAIDAQDAKGRTALSLAVNPYSFDWQITDTLSKERQDTIRLLLDKGADMHAANKEGCTPLHLATTVASLKILLERGADASLLNNDGDDVLRYVAIHIDVVDVCVLHYLLETLQFPVARQIEAYELAAVTHMDSAMSMQLYKKAVELSQKYNMWPRRPSKAVYEHARDVESTEDLEAMFQDDRKVLMYSMHVLEGCLGLFNKCSIRIFKRQQLSLQQLSAGSLESRDIASTFELACYYLEQHHAAHGDVYRTDCSSSQNCHRFMTICSQLTSEAYREGHIEGLRSIALLMLKIAAEEMELLECTAGTHRWFASRLPADRESGNRDDILHRCLDSASILCCLSLDAQETMMLLTTLQRVSSKCKSLDKDRRGLLHMALDPQSMSQRRGSWRCRMWNAIPTECHLQLVRFLLKHSGDEQINQQDANRNTPLHAWLNTCRLSFVLSHMLRQPEEGKEEWEDDEGDLSEDMLRRKEDELKLTREMVEAGCHVDACNDQGETPLPLLQKLFPDFCELNHISLQCLAARVCRRKVKGYHNHLTQQSVDFVNLH